MPIFWMESLPCSSSILATSTPNPPLSSISGESFADEYPSLNREEESFLIGESLWKLINEFTDMEGDAPSSLTCSCSLGSHCSILQGSTATGISLDSRKLQRILDENNIENIKWETYKNMDQICNFILHPLGNQIVRKFLEEQNNPSETRIIVLNVIRTQEEFVKVCTNVDARLAMEQLFNQIKNTQEQVRLVISALSSITVTLSRHSIGKEILMCCFNNFSEADNEILVNIIADNCFDISTNNEGYHVVKKCLDMLGRRILGKLVGNLVKYTLLLVNDPKGNYIVQRLLEMRIPPVTFLIISQMKGRFAFLSMEMYGSRVVEACLLHSDERQSMMIIEEIICSPDFVHLPCDKYGNYVIQSALLVAKEPLFEYLLHYVKKRNRTLAKSFLKKSRPK